MDGTGDLLTEASELLGQRYDVRVATYPKKECLSYPELTELVAKLLPARKQVLVVAESFSGPIGILLASQQRQCTRLVLCASFSESPWPKWIPRLTQGWAHNLIKCGPIPHAASLTPMTLGQWSTDAWQKRIDKAATKLAPEVLRQRLQLALSVDVTSHIKALDIPVLYQQATHDRLVEERYFKILKKAYPRMDHRLIEGPHFLMQAKPQECIETIFQWDS